jgi:hypothetical protein
MERLGDLTRRSGLTTANGRSTTMTSEKLLEQTMLNARANPDDSALWC